jgi:hypothetical protein
LNASKNQLVESDEFVIFPFVIIRIMTGQSDDKLNFDLQINLELK